MRGRPGRQATILCFITSEQGVPQDHPIRKIKALADHELKHRFSVFNQMCYTTGQNDI
jgi:hypothetical protein